MSVMQNTEQKTRRKIWSKILNLPPNAHQMSQVQGEPVLKKTLTLFDFGFEHPKTPLNMDSVETMLRTGRLPSRLFFMMFIKG